MSHVQALPLHRPPERASRLWVRSALAPPLWSHALAAGLLGSVAIAALDMAISSRVALAGVLAVIALAVGLLGERGDALVVACVCVAVAAASGLWGAWSVELDGDVRHRRGVERQRRPRLDAARGGDHDRAPARCPAASRRARARLARRGGARRDAAGDPRPGLRRCGGARSCDPGPRSPRGRPGRVAPGARGRALAARTPAGGPAPAGDAAGHRHGTGLARRGDRRRPAARVRRRRRGPGTAALAPRPLGAHAAAGHARRAVRRGVAPHRRVGAALHARGPRVRRAGAGAHGDRARQHRAEPRRGPQRGHHGRGARHARGGRDDERPGRLDRLRQPGRGAPPEGGERRGAPAR